MSLEEALAANLMDEMESADSQSPPFVQTLELKEHLDALMTQYLSNLKSLREQVDAIEQQIADNDAALKMVTEALNALPALEKATPTLPEKLTPTQEE